MKRLFVALLAVVLVGGISSVNAMSEADLLAKLTSSYTINGKEVKLDNSVAVQIERYLNAYEVSSADADIIAEQVDEVVKYLKQNNISSYDQLTKSGKSVITNAVNTISKKTSVKASISDKGELTVYAPGTNKVFAVVDSEGVAIRKTGNEYILVAVAGIVSLVGIAVVAKKIAGANA